jgi:hypothetical protein
MNVTAPSGRLAEVLCLRWQEQFSWRQTASAYRAVEAWSSRTAEFVRCAPVDGDGRDVVVKFVLRGRYIDTEDQYLAFLHLDRLWRDAGPSMARPPLVLGWSREPPALGMEYVAGRDAPELLLATLCEHADLRDHLRTCGATLGAWHASEPIGSDATGTETIDPILRLARLQGVRWSGLAERLRQERPVRRFRDFGFYNFRVGDAGELLVMDPPRTAVEGDLVHRDVAWFMSTIDAHVSSLLEQGRTKTRAERATWWRRHRRVRSELFRAFAAGYRDATGRDIDNEHDVRVIGVLEGAFLLGRVRSLVRQRRLGRAVTCARLALDARRRAGHRGGEAV